MVKQISTETWIWVYFFKPSFPNVKLCIQDTPTIKYFLLTKHFSGSFQIPRSFSWESCCWEEKWSSDKDEFAWILPRVTRYLIPPRASCYQIFNCSWSSLDPPICHFQSQHFSTHFHAGFVAESGINRNAMWWHHWNQPLIPLNIRSE